MVSLHGHDATHREERLPLIASDQDLYPERSHLICAVNAEIRKRSLAPYDFSWSFLMTKGAPARPFRYCLLHLLRPIHRGS